MGREIRWPCTTPNSLTSNEFSAARENAEYSLDLSVPTLHPNCGMSVEESEVSESQLLS
jgi:hypothetical protein